MIIKYTHIYYYYGFNQSLDNYFARATQWGGIGVVRFKTWLPQILPS